MTLYKNASQTWIPAGTIGPFSVEGVDDDEVGIVECSVGNIYNIQGSDVVKFDPPQLRFVTSNLTLSAYVQILIHSSFPPNFKIPETECKVYNQRHDPTISEENDEQEQVQETNRDEASSFDNNDNKNNTPELADGDILLGSESGDDNDDKEWLLLSHFIPPIPAMPDHHTPKPDNLYQWKCQPSTEGTRIIPDRLYYDYTNYTERANTFMALHVHTSFPDNEPIEPADCEFTIVQGPGSNTNRNRENNGHNKKVRDAIQRTAASIWMNYLVVISLIASVAYFLLKPKTSLKKKKQMSSGKQILRHRSKGRGSKKQRKEKKLRNRENNPAVSLGSNSPSLKLKDYILSDSDDGSSDDEREGTEDSKGEVDGDNDVSKVREQSTKTTADTEWEVVRKQNANRDNTNTGTSSKKDSVMIKGYKPSKASTSSHTPTEEAHIKDTLRSGTKEEEASVSEPTLSDDSSTKGDEVSPPYVFVLYVDGMTCSGCERVVCGALDRFAQDSIVDVMANSKDGTVTIQSSSPRLDILSVAKAMKDVGFDIYMGPNSNNNTQNLDNQARGNKGGGRKNDFGNDINAAESSPTSLKPPPGFGDAPPRETTLSLMDELRTGSLPIRRYRCRCGSKDCICSNHPIDKDDPGQDISLEDLCKRLESNLGGSFFGAIGSQPFHSCNATSTEASINSNLQHSIATTSRLEDWIQSSNGGSDDFRQKLASMSIPCDCGKSHDET